MEILRRPLLFADGKYWSLQLSPKNSMPSLAPADKQELCCSLQPNSNHPIHYLRFPQLKFAKDMIYTVEDVSYGLSTCGPCCVKKGGGIHYEPMMGSGAYLHFNKCVAQGKLKEVWVLSSAGAPRVENSSKSRHDFLAAPGHGAERKGRRPTGRMISKRSCVSKGTERWGKGTYGQHADRGTERSWYPQ